MKTTNQQLNQHNEAIEGRKVLESSNSILVIHPYFDRGMWVFDDDRVGLTKEPFVAGADKFIDYHLNKIEKLEEGKKGFNMVFSVIPFKDFDYAVGVEKKNKLLEKAIFGLITAGVLVLIYYVIKDAESRNKK